MESTPQENDVPDLLPHNRLSRTIREDYNRPRRKAGLDMEPSDDQKNTEIRSQSKMNKKSVYIAFANIRI